MFQNYFEKILNHKKPLYARLLLCSKGAENVRVRWIFWYLNQNRVGVNSALDETALAEDPLHFKIGPNLKKKM